MPIHFAQKPDQHRLLAHWRATAVLAFVLTLTTLHSQASPYSHRAADGTVTFSDAPITNGKVKRTRYKGKTPKASVKNPCRGLSIADLDAKGEKLKPHFVKASEYSGVPVTLLKAVARAESCFDPKAVSRVGARGIMQLMPATAKTLGIKDSFNVAQNILGGARYLSAMLARYSNDLDLALAAYNAGPGNVDRYKGVPPFKETQHYILSVRAFQDRYTAMLQPGTLVATNED